jgi:hypothetical protein
MIPHPRIAPLLRLLLLAALLAGPAPGAEETGAPPVFTDVTRQAGLHFRHVHGGGGPNPRRYYIETMGSGAAFVDCDQDGWLDLYLVNGQHLDDPAAPRATNALFRNTGSGTFADLTQAAGVGDTGYGMGVVAGDYDNDGYPDLYVTNYGPNVLYHNEGGGRFRDATDQAGVGDDRWGVGCAFLDYDNDGDLDLYVANYLEYRLADAARKLRPYLAPGAAAPPLMGYPHPDNFPGQADLLYRNEGDGTFRDVTRAAGVYHPEGKGMGMACADYDNDGDLDIFVANDQTENHLFENQGKGAFAEVGLLAGVAYDRNGRVQSGMGADFADFDNDGDLDLFLTNYQGETSALYVNEGKGQFSDQAAAAGLAIPSLPFVKWAALFLDCDNDGDRDLFVVNGHVLDNAEQFDSSTTYRQPRQLFVNLGPGPSGGWRFAEAGARAGEALQEPHAGRGAAVGDYDNDGDPDLIVQNSNEAPSLLRNDGGNARHWLGVRLVGRQSNRDGVGARVRVWAGGRGQLAERRAGHSYLSHSDGRLLFGLGASPRADSAVVQWPSGRVDVLRDLAADRYVVVEEGGGR